ncbi:hypothetical protein EVAR_51944_1 [Eumeta japonica]|uniref:Uncharacterized protein n=1 Tax=Eumeta variegata TaxID=151549 RepID=A0A4C1YLY8_EUMVA|nr:hypothetical protein EVAR_51944_1 [Eumeta japonica]
MSTQAELRKKARRFRVVKILPFFTNIPPETDFFLSRADFALIAAAQDMSAGQLQVAVAHVKVKMVGRFESLIHGMLSSWVLVLCTAILYSLPSAYVAIALMIVQTTL